MDAALCIFPLLGLYSYTPTAINIANCSKMPLQRIALDGMEDPSALLWAESYCSPWNSYVEIPVPCDSIRKWGFGWCLSSEREALRSAIGACRKDLKEPCHPFYPVRMQLRGL